MTEQIKAKAIEVLNRPQCKWTIESAREAISQQERVIEYWNGLSRCYEAKYKISDAKNMIELLQAIISILIEREAELEAMERVSSCYGEVPYGIVRKIVAVMANKLRKAGISLSVAFKQAWCFVKFCVTHKHFIKRLTG